MTITTDTEGLITLKCNVTIVEGARTARAECHNPLRRKTKGLVSTTGRSPRGNIVRRQRRYSFFFFSFLDLVGYTEWLFFLFFLFLFGLFFHKLVTVSVWTHTHTIWGCVTSEAAASHQGET